MNDHLTFIDLSLSRIRSFLNKLDNPQDKIKNIIHVAGTNGKGSTCAFLRSILEGHGYSVNVFTSPHLVSYNERFRLAGELISDEYLEEIQSKLQNIEGYKDLTIFELSMVIGFMAFYEKQADFCIIEVGLGGRLDASNVIKKPLLSIITTIGIDHENFLGNTKEQIAYEKAGIIKENSIIITDYQEQSALKVIKKQALRLKSTLIAGGIDYSIDAKNDIPFLSYNNKEILLNKLSLVGKHQYYNASLAIVACINILKDSFDYDNLSIMLSKANWRARLQLVSSLYGVDFINSKVYLDGAHNVSGAEALCSFIRQNFESHYKIYIFLGMLLKKDLSGFFAVLSKEINDRYITIYPLEVDGHDSYSKLEISKEAQKKGLKVVVSDSLSASLFEIESSSENNVIFLAGSLYLLGKVLADNNI